MPSSLTVRPAPKLRMELQELTCSRNSPGSRGRLSGHQEVQAEPSIPERVLGRRRSGLEFDTGRGRGVLPRALAGGVGEVGPRVGRESVGAGETSIRDFNVPSTTLPQYDSQVFLSGEVLSRYAQ